MWYSTTVTIAFVVPLVLPFVVAVVPVPLTLTVCGLPTPLLVTVITLLRGPAALGLNVTPNAQVAPAANVPQELLATANSPPVPATLEMSTVALPMLRTFIVCAALVVLTVVSGSESALTIESTPLPGGELPVTPAPLNETVSAPPPA